MRNVVVLVLVLALFGSGCSGRSPSSRSATRTPRVSVPAPIPGEGRSTVATAGLRLYFDTPTDVSRGTGFQARLIVVNEGKAVRHFEDTSHRVWVTQKALPDSIGMDDLMIRGPRPLDLQPGASATTTFTLGDLNALTVGQHEVRSWIRLDPSVKSAAGVITLQTPPVQVLFR